MKKVLKVPKFKSEDKERDFWSEVDLSQYYDPSDLKPANFPNLRPSSKPISIRLPGYMISRLKEMANSVDVPYQSLIKQFIAKGLAS